MDGTIDILLRGWGTTLYISGGLTVAMDSTHWIPEAPHKLWQPKISGTDKCPLVGTPWSQDKLKLTESIH